MTIHATPFDSRDVEMRRRAAKLTHQQYKTLKNTVCVVRGSGMPLSVQQRVDLEKFEALCRAYEARTGVRA